MPSPNDTDGLDERPVDPREDGRDEERGGESGEVRWEPLDIYSDSIETQSTVCAGRPMGQSQGRIWGAGGE